MEKLLKKFSDLNLDRNSLVIALGGGTIGDITGFAASIYLRGIEYIQIPTTLLAQVDSAHGSKTGINFNGYKNQLGSFYPPLAILIDSRFILSLSTEQVVDGLGEIIKAGLIKDTSIISLLKKHTVHSLAESSDINNIIRKSIAVKNYFTNKDFKDNGSRQILNVGHTLGHAIELKYGIGHGRAVLIGMIQELIITESLKLTHQSIRENLIDLLAHLEININTDLRADWKIICHDKKIIGNLIYFPILKKEGAAKLIKLDLEKLKEYLPLTYK